MLPVIPHGDEAGGHIGDGQAGLFTDLVIIMPITPSVTQGGTRLIAGHCLGQIVRLRRMDMRRVQPNEIIEEMLVEILLPQQLFGQTM